MSLRKSMYRMVSLFIAIPVLLFSVIILHIYNDKLQEVITESLQSVASAQIAEMTSFCKQQINDLTLIGGMEVSHAALRGELDQETLAYLNDMLRYRVQITSYLRSAALIDPDYRLIACSEKNDEITAHDGVENLINDMGDKPFYISNILDAYSDGGVHKSVVSISRIKDGNKVLGYAIMEINLDFYDDIRKQAELWNSSTFYLLDGKSQIISAGTTEENRTEFVTTVKDRADYNKNYASIDSEANPHGSFSFKLRGKHYTTYYSDVQNTDWRFLLTVNMDDYLASRTIYCVLASILAILCVTFAILIGFFTSKRIVRPIQSISDTLMKIQQQQDYSLRVESDHKDEIGSLSTEINRLLNFIEMENIYQIQQHRLLKKKAEHDALTKVLNTERINHYLYDAVNRHRADRTEMAVLFIDVDDFKAFNTDYGHDVGDQVLLFLSSLLARETKGTVGRVGGDEFLVVMEQLEILRTLDNCLNQINELSRCRFSIRGTGETVPVFCCIGAVRIDFGQMHDAGSVTAQKAIQAADKAMYQAKNNGKHGYVICDYE